MSGHARFGGHGSLVEAPAALLPFCPGSCRLGRSSAADGLGRGLQQQVGKLGHLQKLVGQQELRDVAAASISGRWPPEDEGSCSSGLPAAATWAGDNHLFHLASPPPFLRRDEFLLTAGHGQHRRTRPSVWIPELEGWSSKDRTYFSRLSLAFTIHS